MIKIIACEDIPKMLEFITNIVNSEEDMCIIDTATSKDEVIDKVKSSEPDIVLLDIQLESEKAGIDAAEIISTNCPKTKIIMLTSYDDSELIIESYYAGAVDYITKSPGMQGLVEQIRKVYSQEDFLGPNIVKNLHNEISKYRMMHDSLLFFINNFSQLSPSEKDILKQLYYGKTRAQIAKDNYIAVTTVHTHVKHILKKLDYNSTKELVSFLRKIKLFENFIK